MIFKLKCMQCDEWWQDDEVSYDCPNCHSRMGVTVREIVNENVLDDL